jgi:outer membrane protein assembly factor BamE (lipoprotein component of BamABCDE complex)
LGHETELASAEMGVDGRGRSRRCQLPRGSISGSLWEAESVDYSGFGMRTYCDRGLSTRSQGPSKCLKANAERSGSNYKLRHYHALLSNENSRTSEKSFRMSRKRGAEMKGIVIALVLCLAGCASSIGTESIRNENEASIAGKITRGKTTKEEVKAALGTPYTTSITDSGNEQWSYMLNEGSASAANFIPIVGPLAGSNLRSKTVVILFDKTGRVINYTMNDSTMTVGGVGFAR